MTTGTCRGHEAGVADGVMSNANEGNLLEEERYSGINTTRS